MRHDTEENWLLVADSFIPLAGEPCVTDDGEHKGQIKIGDGTQNWGQLQYLGQSISAYIESIQALDNQINITNNGKNPKISVKIAAGGDNALKVTEQGLKVEMGASPEYTIEKEDVATDGFFSQYVLKKDGIQSGVKIDIPKDYLVKQAQIKESAGEGDPSGIPEGNKYIDFVVNTKDTDGEEQHIYLNVNELVDAYIAGNGIEIQQGNNTISAKVVNENGLSVSQEGIKLQLATQSLQGAMSNTDKEKIDSIENGAQVNKIETISINGEAIQAQGKDVGIPAATALKLGLVKPDQTSLSVDGSGIMSVKSVNIKLLTQDPDDLIILNCGSSK